MKEAKSNPDLPPTYHNFEFGPENLTTCIAYSTVTKKQQNAATKQPATENKRAACNAYDFKRYTASILLFDRSAHVLLCGVCFILRTHTHTCVLHECSNLHCTQKCALRVFNNKIDAFEERISAQPRMREL